MNDIDNPIWPARPHQTGRFELALASVLTLVWIGFIILGNTLAIATNRAIVADEYEPAGTETRYGTLYFGSSNTGSDLLGDIVGATWYSTWFCGLAAAIALIAALPVAFAITREHSAINGIGKVFLRVSATMGLWPLFGFAVLTVYIHEILTTYSSVLFALFVLPTAVYCIAMQMIDNRSVRSRFAGTITAGLRLWATVMMLVALLSFLYSIGNNGSTLATIARDNATLLTFGIYYPWISALLMVLIAATLRLWATIIEDRLRLRLAPEGDSWVFLPTVLENELDEARVRKEYEGLL